MKRVHGKVKHQCQFCESLLSSGHSLKRHISTAHGKQIESVRSSIVIEKKTSVEIAPEAKNAFIRDQIETIQALQMKLSKLKATKATLTRLIAEK